MPNVGINVSVSSAVEAAVGKSTDSLIRSLLKAAKEDKFRPLKFGTSNFLAKMIQRILGNYQKDLTCRCWSLATPRKEK